MDQGHGMIRASFLRGVLALVVALVLAGGGEICGAWGQENYRTLYRFDGDSVEDYFGRSVSAAGDVIRDGYSDIIVAGWPVDIKGRMIRTLRMIVPALKGRELAFLKNEHLVNYGGTALLRIDL